MKPMPNTAWITSNLRLDSQKTYDRKKFKVIISNDILIHSHISTLSDCHQSSYQQHLTGADAKSIAKHYTEFKLEISIRSVPLELSKLQGIRAKEVGGGQRG